MIETMPGYDVSEISKWLPVNSSDNVTYSSLLGLPVTPQTTAPNTSYNVDTMYMSLTCKNLKTVMAASQGSRVNMDLPPGWAMVSNNNDFALATVTDERHMNAYGMPKVPRPIEFQTTSWIGGEEGSINIVSTSCNLTTSYVELNISCVGRLCSTVAIRPSQEPHDPVFWSVLDTSKERTLNTSLNVLTFLADFVNATKSKKAQASSATEYYLVYPNRPFSNPSSDRDYWVDFSNTTTNEFETRFAQLLNSYYLANIVPLAFAGDLSVEKLGSSHNQYSFRNTTGELSSPRTIFVCNQAWLSVLLVSSLAMMGCAVASAVFCLLRRGPDIIDSFSSITRDNPYMSANVPLDGSNIDGISRTRYLKGIKVKLGDVAPEGDVGHIAIGTPGTQKIATLRRGRLFE